MISAIRIDGTTATMAIEGATDTEVFRAYMRKGLLPCLRVDDIVIMDNLSPHKNQETLDLIESIGTNVKFLPAFSPELNPIEKMWSKVKQSLRSQEIRNLDDFITAIARAIQAVTSNDARNWFACCGYSFI